MTPAAAISPSAHRLRKHADYGLVYGTSRKHQSASLSFFYKVRSMADTYPCARFGITVPRTLGNAVLRNRIKRRVRVVARASLNLLPLEADVVLHPRPAVATMPFPALEREVAAVFATVARKLASGEPNTPLPRTSRRSKDAAKPQRTPKSPGQTSGQARP